MRAERWSLATACLLLGMRLLSRSTGRRLGELDAFLPPAEGVKVLAATDGSGGIPGELTRILNDYDGALARAKARAEAGDGGLHRLLIMESMN